MPHAGRSQSLALLGLLGLYWTAQTSIARGDPSQNTQELQQAARSAWERPWEIGIFYPFQYYQTQNEIGTSSSFTAVGLGVIANRSLFRGIGIMASYQADLNAVTSAAIFSGLNIGAQYDFLGSDSIVHDSSSFSLRSYPVIRSSVSLGIGQRNYDFRTLISNDEAQKILAERKVKVELEGSGWAPFARFQIDGRLFGFSRVGGFLQYQMMLPNAVQKTRVTSYFAGLSYDFSRLSGVSE